MHKQLDRIKEPSTWAGLASAAAALGPIWLSQPIVGAIVSVLGAVAVLLREKSGTK